MEAKLAVLMDFNERQQQLLEDLKHVYNWQHNYLKKLRHKRTRHEAR